MLLNTLHFKRLSIRRFNSSLARFADVQIILNQPKDGYHIKKTKTMEQDVPNSSSRSDSDMPDGLNRIRYLSTGHSPSL